MLAQPFPLLLGDGKHLTHEAFLATGNEAVGTLLALVLLKPLVTVLCLVSGARGGYSIYSARLRGRRKDPNPVDALNA